jgi:hypothetical protein
MQATDRRWEEFEKAAVALARRLDRAFGREPGKLEPQIRRFAPGPVRPADPPAPPR